MPTKEMHFIDELCKILLDVFEVIKEIDDYDSLYGHHPKQDDKILDLHKLDETYGNCV